jgi:hypothetical protein
MMTFEQKYIKYKSKYLTLKKLAGNINTQNEDTSPFLDMSNLSDTPVFVTNNQTGGESKNNNIFDISYLSETPINNNQNGGNKSSSEISSSESSSSESSSSDDSKISTVSSGGGKKKKSKIKKTLGKDSSESILSKDSTSSELSLSSSSDLSVLEDSDS